VSFVSPFVIIKPGNGLGISELITGMRSEGGIWGTINIVDFKTT
jgi:hypothetical protein